MAKSSEWSHSSKFSCITVRHRQDDSDVPPATATMILPATNRLSRNPSVPPSLPAGNHSFLASSHAILQFLPSGVCVSLTLHNPVTLGRGSAAQVGDMCDLTELNAEQHGVSRQHCLLRRVETRLFLTDLGSTNGTFVNGQRLQAQQEVSIADGDHVILGTLHMNIFFSVPPTASFA